MACFGFADAKHTSSLCMLPSWLLTNLAASACQVGLDELIDNDYVFATRVLSQVLLHDTFEDSECISGKYVYSEVTFFFGENKIPTDLDARRHAYVTGWIQSGVCQYNHDKLINPNVATWPIQERQPNWLRCCNANGEIHSYTFSTQCFAQPRCMIARHEMCVGMLCRGVWRATSVCVCVC